LERREAFAETTWLADHLADPQVQVLDASWQMHGGGRSALAEYLKSHIPGAGFFDLDRISDPASPYPHMLPSAEDFARHMGRLGLAESNRIVVYDTGGLHAAARAYWMFKVFSHDDVRILDGGLAKWQAEGRPLEAGETDVSPGHFSARLKLEMLASKGDVLAASAEKSSQILDARGAERFYAREPEPRPGLRGGHMPGAKNLHYAQFFADDGTFVSSDRLKEIFAAANLDPNKPAITSCGTGVTACILALGLNLLGREDVQVYDGSWVEWGSDPETPIVTGQG
jgi:thiosulfate/3-mercaptopyruvate sulfurtransferase